MEIEKTGSHASINGHDQCFSGDEHIAQLVVQAKKPSRVPGIR